MSESLQEGQGGSEVVRSEGITVAERYLGKLCERSFLSLWSYPGVYRDQGKDSDKGDGKEVCDLLVIFENHILIFSDKDCHFADSGNLEQDWGRWYKKTIRKSAEQLWGAERWIKQFPNRLFLDRQCKNPFPIALPVAQHAIFHRIVVAHDAARRCHEVLGGSGSLMLNNRVIGNAHLSRPFTIGQIDPARGFVHVFDDTTLDIVMNTLDTISDFTQYLTKKEQFLSTDKVVQAAGEEELLAVYLHDLNREGEHDFIIDGNYDVLSFAEGFWDSFVRSPERQAQNKSNRVSYAWDTLIERFVSHAMTGTQYFTSGRPLSEQEKMFRFLAREPRTRRRALAISLREMLERSVHSRSPWEARVMLSSNVGDPLYVFLILKRKPDISDEEYREVRVQLLSNYCRVAKHKYPQAKDIIGIATEDGSPQRRSEDLFYLDASDWNADREQRAREIQQRLGILKEVKPTMNREYEYPVDHTGKPRRRTPSRNSPCPCGSGERFKRCHGKGPLDKRDKQ